MEVLGGMTRWRRWRERAFGTELDWLQVEITTHCNSACRYCPHTVYSDIWQSRHMTAKTFERLLPTMANVDLVHLQGWGEPLLHPNFSDLVRRAKTTGCRMGTTFRTPVLST